MGRGIEAPAFFVSPRDHRVSEKATEPVEKVATEPIDASKTGSKRPKRGPVRGTREFFNSLATSRNLGE
jgi:hypothetical protein